MAPQNAMFNGPNFCNIHVITISSFLRAVVVAQRLGSGRVGGSSPSNAKLRLLGP